MQISFFAATDIKLHRHLRSRVTAAYSMSSMLSMESLIQDVANQGWTKFRSLVAKGQPIELDKWVSYFTFDVVGTLALGGPLGMIQQGKDVDGIIGSIHDGFWLMANMGNMPLQMFWFNNPIAQWLVKNLGGRRLNAFSVFLDWLEARVDTRMKEGLGDQRRDLLQHFIDAKDQSGNPVKKGDVMIEGVNILGAGADTTTVAILAVLGVVLQHSSHKQRLMAEIDQAYTDLDLADKGEEISFKDCENLPFLCAVVKESMRLHPSIIYQLPRVLPAEGLQVGKYHFDRNVICGISAASMNRSVDIFGPDASTWVPERWIVESEADKSRVGDMNRDLTTVSAPFLFLHGPLAIFFR
jgi:cytochrome P450